MSDSDTCDRHLPRPRLEACLAAMPRLALGLAVAAVTFAAAPAARADDFTWQGRVVRVVDGDTIDVRLRNGNRERIRLIGIDSPERGDCGSLRATARARKLARRQQVLLRGDANVDMRDRFGRLLAYVWLPSGRDLGFRMISPASPSPTLTRRGSGAASPTSSRSARRSGRRAASGRDARRRRSHPLTRAAMTAAIRATCRVCRPGTTSTARRSAIG